MDLLAERGEQDLVVQAPEEMVILLLMLPSFVSGMIFHPTARRLAAFSSEVDAQIRVIARSDSCAASAA